MEHQRLRVLVVDDEANIRRMLHLNLKDFGCDVQVASNKAEAKIALSNCFFDLVLSDLKLGKDNGLDMICEFMKFHKNTKFAIMTAYSSIEGAVDSMTEGAFDYIPKPFTSEQLAKLLQRVGELKLLRENVVAKREAEQRSKFFIGYESLASQQIVNFVERVAPTDSTVLIAGESGTGKSELAKYIHEGSRRASQPFVTVYCTTLAENLIESELFGYTKGAFTGAVQEQKGKLEVAEGGTLFLDEIGDLSVLGQAKLLRFLQDRVFERVGGHKEIAVDTRIIAATNKDLAGAVRDGKFREDLYYRINVLEFAMPPLRERGRDIQLLIRQLLLEAANAQGEKIKDLPPEVESRLLKYSWPGNIRELRNTIERMIVLSRGREVTVEDLPHALRGPQKQNHRVVSGRIEDMERELISQVLSEEKNLEKAAEVLGITKVTLWRKRKEFGLE